jgi:hypothetical protein
MPSWSAASTLASAVPRVSWKWTAERRPGDPVAQAAHDVRHLRRDRDADRVADRKLVAAERRQPRPPPRLSLGATLPS